MNVDDRLNRLFVTPVPAMMNWSEYVLTVYQLVSGLGVQSKAGRRKQRPYDGQEFYNGGAVAPCRAVALAHADQPRAIGKGR